MTPSESAGAQANLRSPIVALDIEVAGLEWEEVDEATRHYLMARKKGGKEDDIQNRLALVRGLGRVVSIGMWNLAKDQASNTQVWTWNNLCRRQKKKKKVT